MAAQPGPDATLFGADGGPAFPNECADTAHGRAGMSLRDYFATHCDIGDMEQLSLSAGVTLLGPEHPPATEMMGKLRWWADYRAALRYMEADAMLKAREKGGAA
ncbi:MAG: hypothetical protein RLZZ373_3226 [Pseudomonadota bacterium]|jgi:hypothetical protein